MIIKFNEFLNEYRYYRGPFSSVGFKNDDASEEFTLNVDINYDNKNTEIIKNILAKYEIPYNKLNIIKTSDNIFGKNKKHQLNLSFLSYNDLEAASIISTLMKELENRNISFNPESINVTPKPQLYKNRKKSIGFR